MGLKLSPPILPGAIPAFYLSDQGIVVTIPFSMSRAVGSSQVNGFNIKIKTVQSSNQIYSTTITNANNVNIILNDRTVSFIITDENDKKKFRIGQFYKVQLAYINGIGSEAVTGFYSTVAVAKYTTKPDILIDTLDNSKINSNLYTYTGIYNQSGSGKDATERVYSYRFDLYDNENNLLETSTDLIHNSEENDDLNLSKDTYTIKTGLEKNKTYYIQYSVTTVNNLIVSSPQYKITQRKSIDPELKAEVHVDLNYDNGYINVNLVAIPNDDGAIDLVTGSFILARASEDTNYGVWEEIYNFKLTSQVPTFTLYKDFSIEQGKNYIYSIQQYNDRGLYSNRILSSPIYSDFEDAFLYDGRKQLKIKYNPKVSSFKKDLLETKTDTIGGQYPFIFRNSNVYYSEFPISGLVSYHMDEEELFLSAKEYLLDTPDYNLTDVNVASERIFKMKVLEWLTNGKPKVFRSPTEGNFIVRLMNTSFAPNDTVGRMLHTFSATAYEIADFNYENLINMNFIVLNDKDKQSMQWETVEFFTRKDDGTIEFKKGTLNRYPATTLRVDNMTPGDIINIEFKDDSVVHPIKIGVTGSYYIDTGVDIKSISVPNDSFGSMTYSYLYNQPNAFNDIDEVSLIEVPCRQFIGEHDILKEILYVKDDDGNWIKNPKINISEIIQLKIYKRHLQPVTNFNGHTDIFYIFNNGKKFYDAYNKTYYDAYKPDILINDSTISLEYTDEKEYNTFDDLSIIQSGNGVVTELSYILSNITYNIEYEAKKATKDSNLYSLKMAMTNYESKYNEWINRCTAEGDLDPDKDGAQALENLRQSVNDAYREYILALVAARRTDLINRGGAVNE